MPERKRKVKLAYVIIVVAVFAAAMIILSTSKDAVVISHGIVFYRSIRRTILAVGCILTALIVFLYFYDMVKQTAWRRQKRQEEARAQEAEEEKRHREKQSSEPLSVSKNMDSVRLREILDNYGAGEWKNLGGELRQIHIQLDMMDEQQEKLAHLLRNNGAEALANTEEILDKVEQHMCRSVRKIINYMDVAEPDRQEDVKKVLEKLYACHADNQTQLQQVQEFLFALADFLNTQGDDDGSVQMLELYKTTILDSIKD